MTGRALYEICTFLNILRAFSLVSLWIGYVKNWNARYSELELFFALYNLLANNRAIFVGSGDVIARF